MSGPGADSFPQRATLRAASPCLPDPTSEIEVPPHPPVTSLFAAQVRSRPDATAVTQGDRRWSYRELDAAARRLAATLARHGMDRGCVVAILGERSFGLVSCMLGVMYSGAAFMTIDPALPVVRQRLMLGAAGVRAICRVGDAPLPSGSSRAAAGPAIIDVDPLCGAALDGGSLAAPRDTELPVVGEVDAAYVFFTSGSSGQPKGVLGRHRGLSHFLAWQRDRFAIGTADRVAQFTSLSFDPLLRDVFLPLTSGATLCLPGREDDVQPLAWLERSRVTVLHAVPTLMRSWLMQEPDAGGLDALRWVFLAGEPLTASLVRAWRGRFPGSGPIVNLYGPTETTLAKCFHVVDGTELSGVLPAGHPLPQTQVLVVDPAGRMCGIGEPGEVWLRTPFRTLGYLDAQQQDAHRFVPNPFRPADARDLVYRTGDRGRYGVDGALELLGRVDEQVKIRGVRVEPAEVRAALEEHPDVQACFVLGQADTDGGTVLAAHVVCRPGSAVRSAALASFLRRRLPSAMVPSAWSFLDALPRLPSGKVDRHALPRAGHADGPVAPAVPATPLERTLCRIVAELTHAGPVGLHDDFFALGGHSLLAVRLVAQVREATGTQVAAAEFMREPTVAGLVALLGEATQHRRRHPAIEPYRPGDAPLFFAPGYDGHAHDARRLLAGLPPERAVFGITAPPEAGLGDDPVGTTAAFCVARIREVQPRGPYRIAGYSFGGKVAHAMACRLRDQGEHVEHLFLIEPSSGLRSPVPAPGAPRPHCHRVFDGHAILVRSWRQPLVHLSTPGLGWEHLCSGGLTVHDVPTTHWGLAAPPHADRTAAILAGHLAGTRVGAGGGGARVPFDPLPEAFHRARSLAFSGRPQEAWALLRTLAPGSLPGWSLDVLLDAARHAVNPGGWQGAWGQARALVRTCGPDAIGLFSHFLGHGRGDLALALLPGEGEALPAAGMPETIALARALCAWTSGDVELAQGTLQGLDVDLRATPDRYVGVLLALQTAQWKQPMGAFLRRILERGSGAARADVLACLLEDCARRGDWRQAVGLGEAAVAAHPDVSAPYPNLIEALVRTGRVEAARRYHREATQRFLGWGPFRSRLDRALGAHGARPAGTDHLAPP